MACHRYSVRLEDCRAEKQQMCVNACNDRGTCLGGFCHCQKGGWQHAPTQCIRAVQPSGAHSTMARGGALHS